MANFKTIVDEVGLNCSGLDPTLIRQWVNHSLNKIWYKRDWSFKRAQFNIFPSLYNVTDTVTVSPNDPTVTSTGAFTPDMTGKQIRITGGTTIYPIYTIAQYVSATVVLMDSPWKGPALSGASYQIFQSYITVPEDFESWLFGVNPQYACRVNLELKQADLARLDPQRTSTGVPTALVFLDHAKNFSGSIGSIVRIVGSASNPAPISTTTLGFSYPSEITFSVKIVTGGALGAMSVQWFANSLPGTPGAAQSIFDSQPIDLLFGAQVYFPPGTYVTNDLFVFTCSPKTSTGMPRYEAWPRPVGMNSILPMTYSTKLQLFDDDNPTLPEPLARRSDVVVNGALSMAAAWPGTNTTRNPYSDWNRVKHHTGLYERGLQEMVLKDNDIDMADFMYTEAYRMSIWSPQYLFDHDAPFMG